MFWIVALLLTVYVFYKYFIVPNKYWKDQGIAYRKPIPIFGNFIELVLRQEDIYHLTKKLYNEFPEKR